VAVVAFHVSHLSGVATPESFTFVRLYFGQGVTLFFMLSAFVLYYRYFDKVMTKSNIWSYATRRFFRIAPLYYVLLFAYAYYFWWSKDLSISAEPKRDMVLYISFLFNFLPTTTAGLLPASWTLGVEAIFYSILPLMIVRVRTIKSAVLLLILSVNVACIVQPVAWSMFKTSSWMWATTAALHGPAFCLGALCYLSSRRNPQSSSKMGVYLLGGSAIAFILLHFTLKALFSDFPDFERIPDQKGPANLFSVTISTFALAPVLYAFATVRFNIMTNVISVYIGRISYSIYLLHPLIILGLRPIYEQIGPALHLGTAGIFLCACFLTYAVLIPLSALTYTFIERPLIRLGSMSFRSEVVPQTVGDQLALPSPPE
jgi:peptidoglycan/LPS O-acetylase OafA/YrhL